MLRTNNLPPPTEDSTESAWGNFDEADWASIADSLQAAADANAPAPADLSNEAAEPITTSLTPVKLDQTPQYITNYRIEQMPADNEKQVPHPEYTPWWEDGGFHTVAKVFQEPIFKEVAPDEEFIVAQGTRSIRVYNFGAPLSAARQEDLEKFTDIATQFMGERAYDFISDVIIGDFSRGQDEDTDKRSYAGFGWSGRGVVLINSAILADEAPTDETAEGSSFLQTLLHEFGGHLVHGDIDTDPQARSDLEQFAEAVGWDIKGMQADGHDWNAKGVNNQAYAPLYASQNFIPMSPDGSPTKYGTANPKETFGETSKHVMIGSKVLDMMPATSGAWLDTLQKRLLKPGETMGDRPIATPLEREPVHITRHTGAAITYPWQVK